jgi:pimeloyl-ACP methyl ester carboxylesterase
MTPKRGTTAPSSSRSSSALIRRLVWGTLILGAGMFAVLIGVGLFLTYRITTTHNNIENVTPASYLLPSYENLNFTDARGGEHDGWLLVGLKGAPVIILCHGYNSNRSELLSLGTTLQSNHFNVYLFNFGGPRSKDYISNLGIWEASILTAAIARVTKLPSINSHRVGLYGTTLGGYATLAAGEQNPIVKALVVDDTYEQPTQMFDFQVDRLLGGAGSLFRLLSRAEFRLFTFRSAYPNIRSDLPKLAGTPKLFLASEDAPALKKITEDLYNNAPQPKRLLVLPRTQATLVSGPERKEYENQVLSFFLDNLPLRAD